MEKETMSKGKAGHPDNSKYNNDYSYLDLLCAQCVVDDSDNVVTLCEHIDTAKKINHRNALSCDRTNCVR